MSTSDRLAARINQARAARSAPPNKPPLFAISVAAGLLLGGVAFVHGTGQPTNTLPPTPVVSPEPVLAVEPALPVPEPVSVDQPPAQPQRCVPYASNGTYLPELCGGHDAFSARAERVLADRVKEKALSHTAEKLLARCDRDWLPSTCAQMRAELAQ